MQLIPPHKLEKTKGKLLSKMTPEPYSGCWLWTAAYFGHKHPEQARPALSVGGKTHFAYRISFEAFVGEIPDGLFVLHKCDTPGCINHRHLFLGTNSINQRDSSLKGRARPHGKSNYTPR